MTDRLAIAIEQSPALTLVKSATPMSYDHVGQVITYTYVVTNTGNVSVLGRSPSTTAGCRDLPADDRARAGASR